MRLDPQRQRLVDIVNQGFFHNKKKAEEWLYTDNPLLDNVSPDYMIKTYRYKQLKRFIISRILENSLECFDIPAKELGQFILSKDRPEVDEYGFDII